MFKLFEPNKIFKITSKAPKYVLFLFIVILSVGLVEALILSPEDYTVAISENTIADVSALGFAAPEGFVPASQFGTEALSDAKNIVILALGGLMVGFGARYAGGCTSGHAISGISNLQPASLLAVVGFFIGGLLMTHVLFPLIY